jgi:hypothetical protein
MSLAISILTLFATALIPVAIYWLGRKGERMTNSLLAEQRHLLGIQRLNTLAAQAEEMSDPKDLHDILEEARSLTTGRSRYRVIEAYWRNPHVPLCGSVQRLDSMGARITAEHLRAKLDGTFNGQAMQELEVFVSHARKFDGASFIASRDADWILSRFSESSGPGDIQIRELLGVSPDNLFGALLDRLDSYSVSTPPRVNIVAGVCSAYLFRIGYSSTRKGLLPETREKSSENMKVSGLLASNLASLLHHGSLYDLARWNADGCSIPTDSCAALVGAVGGAVSFCNSHLAKRFLKSAAAMHINVASLGTTVDYFEFGKAKFAYYQPELLDQFTL